jgi:tRNA(Ile)-lysidine synthetase-like protein
MFSSEMKGMSSFDGEVIEFEPGTIRMIDINPLFNLSYNNYYQFNMKEDLYNINSNMTNVDDILPLIRNSVFNSIKRRLHADRPIAFLLSGGVDSMVCATVLKKLQAKYDFNLVAVHIDYANRTYKEYEFVKDWCAFMKIPLYTRHITEINRKDCMDNGMRNIYEEYTKDVRFETYKSVSMFPRVILGHNYDDCFENILTNICNKEKYDNLKGITSHQFNGVVNLLRPMLNIKKKDIYLFAYNNKIAYLHDSTPEWSQRGQIRDTVKPVLNKWNREIVPSFFELSKLLSEYEVIIHGVVNNLIVNVDDDKFKIPCGSMMLSKIIWRKILDNLMIYVSYRSLDNLIEKIENIYYDLSYQKNSKKKAILNKTTMMDYSIGDGFLTVQILRHM